MPEKCNIAHFLADIAERYGEKTAVSFKGRSITFSDLHSMSSLYACSLRASGLGIGMRTLMMLRPGIEFIVAVFAVFKTGAIPVFIDPGMGIGNLLRCVRKTKPRALIGIAKAQWTRLLFPRTFNSLEFSFSHESLCPPGVIKLPSLDDFSRSAQVGDFQTASVQPDDTAAIVFTTGSTGPPKGVVYTHQIYIEQKRMISEFYGAGPEHVDMPAFPLFALFSAVMGMPSVIPDFNPSFPAMADPALIARTISENNISFSFASPALWRNLADYCIEKSIVLESLKKVLMAGAPVACDLHEKLRKIAPNCVAMVPYGATEALPVANFSSSDITRDIASAVSSGRGYCVGKPLPGIKIHVIKPTEDPVGSWDDSIELPNGETGEIVVEGKVVTPEYYELAELTRLAKIRGRGGRLMHRMGDMGFFDEKGLLWFKGRKAHRVFTPDGVIYPVCCEAVLKSHPKVFRAALVGICDKGIQTPVAVIEPVPGVLPLDQDRREKFISQLQDIASRNPITKNIRDFLFMSPFPVDIRHNAKISRESLAVWAAARKIQSP
ncbi:MAG: AMP-binding protein [Victivallales bacterium]|nr:AMP-binding protein [Victivallales bacterium]